MSDTLNGWQQVRALNVSNANEGVRGAWPLEVDGSLQAERLFRVLEQAVSWRDISLPTAPIGDQKFAK